MTEIITPFETDKPPATIRCWLTEADREFLAKKKEEEQEKQCKKMLPKLKKKKDKRFIRGTPEAHHYMSLLRNRRRYSRKKVKLLRNRRRYLRKKVKA